MLGAGAEQILHKLNTIKRQSQETSIFHGFRNFKCFGASIEI